MIASGELEEERSWGTSQPSGPSVAPEAEPSSQKLTGGSLARAEPLPGFLTGESHGQRIDEKIKGNLMDDDEKINPF